MAVNSTKRRLLFFLGAFSLTLFFHLSYILKTTWLFNGTEQLSVSGSNRSVFDASDTDIYEESAMAVVKGKGLGVPFQPPLLILFLATIYKFFGCNPLLPKLVFAILASISVVWIICIGDMLFGFTTGLLAGIICALSFNLILLSGVNNTEPLYSFFLVGFFYFLLKRRRKNSVFNSIITGFLAVGAIFTRSEFALVLILAGIWELFFLFKNKSAKLPTLLPYFLVFLFLIPWTIRNYIYMGKHNKLIENKRNLLPRFVPLTLNGPLNFFIGNNPYADGGFNTDFMRGLQMIGPNTANVKFVAHGYAMGMSFIRRNPASALEICKEKIFRYLNGFAGGYLYGNYPAGFPGEKKSTAEMYVSDNRIMLYLHLPLLALGMWVFFKESSFSDKIILIPFATSLLTAVVFFGLARLMAPYLYFYSILLALPFTHWKVLCFSRNKSIKAIGEKTENMIFICIMSTLFLFGIIELGKKYTFSEECIHSSIPITISRYIEPQLLEDL